LSHAFSAFWGSAASSPNNCEATAFSATLRRSSIVCATIISSCQQPSPGTSKQPAASANPRSNFAFQARMPSFLARSNHAWMRSVDPVVLDVGVVGAGPERDGLRVDPVVEDP
jgi:hypothetical protein